MNKVWGLIFVWLIALLAVAWMPSRSKAVKANSPKSITATQAPNQRSHPRIHAVNASHRQMVAGGLRSYKTWDPGRTTVPTDD